MQQNIRFKVSFNKAIELIVWLAQKNPNIDIYHIVKILFFADKKHLNKYGRPILGDTYIHMDNGPVPSAVRDIVTQNIFLSPQHLQKVKDSLMIQSKENYYKTIAKREPNIDYFSKSDIECLESSLKKYGKLSFDDLYQLTHQEKCYSQTNNLDNIDYALMIDDDNPNKNRILQDIQETSSYIQV